MVYVCEYDQKSFRYPNYGHATLSHARLMRSYDLYINISCAQIAVCLSFQDMLGRTIHLFKHLIFKHCVFICLMTHGIGAWINSATITPKGNEHEIWWCWAKDRFNIQWRIAIHWILNVFCLLFHRRRWASFTDLLHTRWFWQSKRFHLHICVAALGRFNMEEKQFKKKFVDCSVSFHS